MTATTNDGLFSSIQNANSTKKEWIIDSGASRHICIDEEALVDYTPYQPHEIPYTWSTSDGRKATAEGYAKARINMALPDGSTNEIVVNCVYMPDGFYNLFSTTTAMEDHGIGWLD
jgi:hypothetical protein